MITNIETGEEVGYIPLNLTEGEESAPFTLRVYPESVEGIFRVTSNPKAQILGKIGGGDFENLALNPLNLSAYFGSYVDVIIKAKASENVPGLSRIFLNFGEKIGRPANWKA